MADGDNEQNEKKGSGGMIVGLLLASVIAAGGGVFMGYSQFGKQPDQKVAKKTQADDGHGAAKGEGKKEDVKFIEGSRIRDLPAITTNLAGSPPAWVRLEAAVLLTPEAAAEPQPAEEEVLLRAINEDVVAYLKTVQLVTLQGPSGFQSLREDLDERVRLRSEGKAQELIIQALILE